MTTVVVLTCLALLLNRALGGGSGLNVVVVVNQSSPDSLALGNFYCEHRNIPPDNVLRISWTGGNTAWSSNDFHTVLKVPLMEMLASRGLADQIDYVALSMDIPFQTRTADSVNSTTSALFYGLKEHSGPSWRTITNSYAGSEAIFRFAQLNNGLVTVAGRPDTCGDRSRRSHHGRDRDGRRSQGPGRPVRL